MARWQSWLRCIGQAMIAKGLKALLLEIPFGGLVLEVAADAIERISKEEPAERDRRASLQELVQAPAGEVQQEAAAAARLAAADQPPEVQQRLAGYLMQVPDVARQSLSRREDPTGKTVPAGRPLTQRDDLLPLLPTRVPRFKEHERPEGVGGWELVQLLGVGGFGEVWKARKLYVDDVALKFCLVADALPDARDRLRHEAAVVSKVMGQGRHPGIVKLQDTYFDADPPCLVYEYVAGGDLAVAIRRWHHQPPADLVERVTRTMLELADIVAFAHQHGVVHRDLKPANILLQPQAGGEDSLRVTDFGIGGVATDQAMVETKTGLTQATDQITALRGAYTPLYASPEQIRGEPAHPRDDVYALGVIWLQMLTGDMGMMSIPADWQRELAERGVTAPVLQVLEKCLAAKAERRLASAAVLLDALKGLTQAAPPGVEVEKTITNSIGMKLVLIPAGKFLMGSPQTEEGRYDNEHQHEVEITEAFYMGQYPVTKGEFAAFVKATGHPNPGAGETDQHPVVEVDWKDAVAFCDWLGQKEDKDYRLPTEAEWEYSCRAGTTTAYSFGDHPNKLKAYGWCDDNAGGAAYKVGEKKPNSWGLYDMHGNVWEWCEDWYDKDYYQKSPGQNPQGPTAGRYRVVRGGSFDDPPRDCRAACRNYGAPWFRSDGLGFRVVRAR
jgi:formylglycine-generating enzyme required for sulfatase activity